MKRPKTLVLALVLAPLATIGAITYYIRAEVNETVEKIVTALSPFAEIRHGDVSVTLGGEVHVYGIDVRPRIVDDSIRIESIDVDTPGLWFLLTGADDLRDGRLPEYSRIELRGVELGLGGAIADGIDRLIAASAQAGRAPMTNCGDTAFLDMQAYRRLGYGSLVSDVVVDFRFEPRHGPLHFHSEWRTRDLANTKIDLEFSDTSPRINQMLANPPSLRHFTIRYEDQSFTERVENYCAKAAGMSVEKYIDSEVRRGDQLYQAQWGFVPGTELRQAYRDFLTHPGEVTIQGSPSAEIDRQSLRLYKPGDIPALLNLRVDVNGRRVGNLGITTTAPNETPSVVQRQPAPATPRTTTPAANSDRVPAQAPKVEPGGYRVVPPHELTHYIGRSVRLRLTRGAVRKGALLQIRNGMARVERRYPGGSMTLVIPLREIERAEVLTP